MNAKVLGKIIGLIFITMGYLLVKDLSLSNGFIFNSILQGLMGYFIVITGVVFLFSEILKNNKLLSFIYNKILAIPAIVLIYFMYIIAPILSIILFLGIYFFPSMFFLKLGESYPLLEQYSQGVIYILSLLSVLFFAYKSNVVMGFVIKSFKTKLFRNYLERYTDPALTRMYTYMIMIDIYISYNFLTFSGINLYIIPSEMLNVIKEVFVTFVAIDSLMQIHLSKQYTKTGESKDKEQ